MQEEALRPIAERLRGWDPRCRTLLFGSRARGGYLKEPDYDLIVVSRKFEGLPPFKRAFLVLKALGP